MFRTLFVVGCILVVSLAGLTEAQCNDGSSLYPFGHENGDQIALGDDGPPGVLWTTDASPDTFFRYYGEDYTKIYVNLNGQVSLGDENDEGYENAATEFFPSPAARQNPPFMTAFWNDLFLNGSPGTLFYQQTTNGDILDKATLDIAVKDKNIIATSVITCTWWNSSSFDNIRESLSNPSHHLPVSTFQIVMVMDNDGLSFVMFNYYAVEWYIAHSLPAVAMLNQGRQSSGAVNLFASGSSLMLDLPQTCANAGVYGRFIIQTNLDHVKILDQPNQNVLKQCFSDHSSLYPFGAGEGDTAITSGDDGPPGQVTFSEEITFYNKKQSTAYININGPISFGKPYLRYWPSRTPIDEVAFMVAFWNDMSLSGTDSGTIFYRLTTDPGILDRFKKDVQSIQHDINPTEVLVATWEKVQYFRGTEDDPHNTFQVVFGYEGDKSYALFVYSYIGWYQSQNGHFAVATFNKGESSGVGIDVGPPPGPQWFLVPKTGNSVNNPGMLIFATHPPLIAKHSPTCVCKVNQRKWVTTYDGKRHPFLHEQKTRMSRYLDHDDPCKFQFTVYNKPTTAGDFKVQWTSFAFGVHVGSSLKYDKNIAMERYYNGTTEIRGRGYRSAETIHPPWEWTSDDNQTHVQLTGDEYGGWVINSTTCPYRMHYAPNCPDPVITFTIDKARYQSSHLVGMCQDCNGDPDNDYRPCAEDPVADWEFWDEIPDVSATCVE